MIQVKTNMGKMGKAGGSLAQEMEKEIKTDYFFTFLCPPAVKKIGRMVNKDYILAVDRMQGVPFKIRTYRLSEFLEIERITTAFFSFEK